MYQKAFTTVFGKLFNPRRNEARPQLCQNHMFVGKREAPPTRPRRFGGLQRHAEPRRPNSRKFMRRRREWKFLPLGNLQFGLCFAWQPY